MMQKLQNTKFGQRERERGHREGEIVAALQYWFNSMLEVRAYDQLSSAYIIKMCQASETL